MTTRAEVIRYLQGLERFHDSVANGGGHLAFTASEEGLTQRQYFMAHAPAVPGWFQPDMPPSPTKPVLERGTPHYKAYQEAVENDFGSDDPETPEAVREHMRALKEWEKAHQQWTQRRNVECILQWPAFWANEMLERSWL